MVYHPYFRGKQFELITVREQAGLMASFGFVPIIAPVREQFRSLKKALEALCAAEAKAIVLINPEYGDHKEDSSKISNFLVEEFSQNDNLIMGIRLHAEITSDKALELCEAANGRSIALIHAGFKDSNDFIANMGKYPNIDMSVFFEDECGKLYQNKFSMHNERVLIRDGFQKRRNKDHPESEFFSDLHITFKMENVTGFGDYLIVGDEYQEGGGPAYTIAIHLTYIDPEQDNAMYVHHFLSDRKDSPKDPAGKFAEALQKLIAAVDDPNSNFQETSAITEFRDLHKRQHFPGLGSSKKLSMIHHIETLAAFRHGNGE